jgi:preprotein translocase subunit SecA
MIISSGLPRRRTRRIETDAARALRLMQEPTYVALGGAEIASWFAAETDPAARVALAGIAASRTLGLTPYPVQLAGALALGAGAVIEMPTGEGKTLVAALAAALRHDAGPVHIATANEYLAARDADTLLPFYTLLGISVAYVAGTDDAPAKQAGYRADVVYATLNTLGFDFLADQLLGSAVDELATGRYASLVVDEADSVLVDGATVPFTVAAPMRAARSGAALQRAAAAFVETLADDDVEVLRDLRSVHLTDAGVDRLVAAFPVDADGAGPLEQDGLMYALRTALRARFVYRRDVDYLVVDPAATAPGGEPYGQPVVVIDPSTGRVHPERRMRDGIHEAIEAREAIGGLEITERPVDVVRGAVTVPNFLDQYPFRCGMSGTASADAAEFARSYGLPVVVLAPHRPSQRRDAGERIFATRNEKFAALVAEIRTRQATGQPVLVGCENVIESELVSALLTDAGVEHRTLSARRHTEEAAVIAAAGVPGTVTVATTMAGRGVDIRLGGDPALATTDSERAELEQRADAVRALGGLAVIAASRFSSRRADLQLRGRCGRQGDPGVTLGFVSLEDDVVAAYAGNSAAKLLSSLSADAGGELTDVPSMRSIVDRAQVREESLTASARKDLLEFDLPVKVQREAFYRFRHSLTRADADTITVAVTGPVWQQRIPSLGELRDMPRAELVDAVNGVFYGRLPDPATVATRDEFLDEMRATTIAHLDRSFALLEGDLEERAQLIKAHMLHHIDLAWAEHLEVLDQIRSQVSLAKYAGVDPHDVFAERARAAFEAFSTKLFEQLTRVLLSLRLEPAPA